MASPSLIPWSSAPRSPTTGIGMVHIPVNWCVVSFLSTSHHVTSHDKVAPAVRPDYYTAVIKRSAGGGGAAAGVATAPAAGVETTATGTGEGNGEPLQGVQVQGQGQGQNGALRVPDVASASVSASAPAPSGSKAVGAAAAPRAALSQGTPTGGSKAPGAPNPSSPAVAGGTGTGAGATGARKGGGKTGPLAAGGSSSKSKGATGGDAKGTVIRMRGLPYRASKSEVMGFFKGCSIPEEGIAFVTRADGRVTGEAYVRFATREDAKMGIRKDREMMVSSLYCIVLYCILCS